MSLNRKQFEKNKQRKFKQRKALEPEQCQSHKLEWCSGHTCFEAGHNHDLLG